MPLGDIAGDLTAAANRVGALTLRAVPDTSEHAAVEVADGRVTAIRPPGIERRSGLIVGGVAVFRKSILDDIAPTASLEQDVLPWIARAGRLAGRRFDGFFVDIAKPVGLADAQESVPAQRRRPAISSSIVTAS